MMQAGRAEGAVLAGAGSRLNDAGSYCYPLIDANFVYLPPIILSNRGPNGGPLLDADGKPLIMTGV